MTIYLDNLEAISVRKVIKKIRKTLQKDINNEQVIELYFIGEDCNAHETIYTWKLNTLTNYLLQIKKQCIIRLTFRGLISFTTRMLLFTPFTKIISPEVLSEYDELVLKHDDLFLDNIIQKYKKLVKFETDSLSSTGILGILDLPNITLIKID